MANKERRYHAATTTMGAGHHLRRCHYPRPIQNELTQSRKCFRTSRSRNCQTWPTPVSTFASRHGLTTTASRGGAP
eukprot:5644479-Pyramimonas_sp.AAC.1